MSPAYAQPDWRPDSKFGVKAWENVKSQALNDVMARVADNRFRDN
jgi:hypothetical protein